MKKLTTLFSVLCLTLALTVPASALDYNIDGPGDPEYGKSTSVEPVLTADRGELPNVDVSKNAALIPPTFGSPTAYTLNTGNPLTPNLAPGYMLGEGAVINGNTGVTVAPPDFNTIPSGIVSGGGTNTGGTATPTPSTGFTEVTSDLYYSGGYLATLDSITGSPIKGAKFEVWYGSNNTTTGELNSLGTFFSDENGQFFVDLLRDGWYKVTELAPAAGYTIKEPATQEFYIKGGESKVITFENVPKNAIICEKYDSVTGAALPGCTFQLKYLGGTSGTGGTVIGTKVTGKNGTAMWTGLAPGAYVLEEVDAADGYNIIQSSETIMLADSGEGGIDRGKET